MQLKKIPLVAFAKAMYGRDKTFKSRVDKFETNFGKISEEQLAVLAQLTYICWHSTHFKEDFEHILKAVATEKPTKMHFCNQITSERWNILNSYVVGIQKWRGAALEPPEMVSKALLDEINKWLGDWSELKDTFLRIYLRMLIPQLQKITFTILSSKGLTFDSKYYDFEEWYTIHPIWPSEPFSSIETEQAYIREAAQEMPPAEKNALLELLENITEPEQPPCMFRFERHQRIRISSIGALDWRGNLPVKKDKNQMTVFCHDIGIILTNWVKFKPADSKLAERIYANLGKPTKRKAAMIQDFFLLKKPNSADAWFWVNKIGSKVKSGELLF